VESVLVTDLVAGHVMSDHVLEEGIYHTPYPIPRSLRAASRQLTAGNPPFCDRQANVPRRSLCTATA